MEQGSISGLSASTVFLSAAQAAPKGPQTNTLQPSALIMWRASHRSHLNRCVPILAALLWTWLVKGPFGIWCPVLDTLCWTCLASKMGKTPPLYWVANPLQECLCESAWFHHGLTIRRMCMIYSLNEMTSPRSAEITSLTWSSGISGQMHYLELRSPFSLETSFFK